MTDHVRIINLPDGHQAIHCDHCRSALLIMLPMSVKSWLAETKRFNNAHRHCPPPAESPQPAAENQQPTEV